jgi:hypothetical protein
MDDHIPTLEELVAKGEGVCVDISSGKRKPCYVPSSAAGLGDSFAYALARGWVVPFVKITPKSYRRFKVRWGFADACNCGERKEKLNRFGRWVAKRRNRIADWLKALLPAPPAE